LPFGGRRGGTLWILSLSLFYFFFYFFSPCLCLSAEKLEICPTLNQTKGEEKKQTKGGIEVRKPANE
jgi:hypothetical protein